MSVKAVFKSGEFRIPRDMEIARSSLTARVENLEYNKCPLCRGEMKESYANDVPVLICLPDRVVMPMKNHG